MSNYIKEIEDSMSSKTSNVYRTRLYIVIQNLIIHNTSKGIKYSISIDNMYERTKERDMIFEKYVQGNGKRIVTGMYNRRYCA